MNQQQEIDALKATIAEKDQDIQLIAEMVFKTLRGLGVEKFDELDNIGKHLLGKLPSLGMDLMFPHKLKARFGHLELARPLLEKYKHFMPQ